MITIPGTIDSIRTLKDKSLKITFETQEITSPQEIAEVFSYSQKPCNIALKEGRFSDDELKDIPEVEKIFENQKTPSERLRSVLFVFWNKHKPTRDFDTFYKKKVEEYLMGE